MPRIAAFHLPCALEDRLRPDFIQLATCLIGYCCHFIGHERFEILFQLDLITDFDDWPGGRLCWYVKAPGDTSLGEKGSTETWEGVCRGLTVMST